MKRLLFLVPVLSVFVLAGCDSTDVSPSSSEEMSFEAGAVLGKADKQDLCHYDADLGTWSLISVAVNAADAHLANHPDGAPLSDVPGMADYIFSSTCVPIFQSCVADRDSDGLCIQDHRELEDTVLDK